MKCPNCGNKLFDQGLSTLYCGACGTFHGRRFLERKELRESVESLWKTACKASGYPEDSVFVAYEETPEWKAHNEKSGELLAHIEKYGLVL